jgi:hypothetical protein
MCLRQGEVQIFGRSALLVLPLSSAWRSLSLRGVPTQRSQNMVKGFLLWRSAVRYGESAGRLVRSTG